MLRVLETIKGKILLSAVLISLGLSLGAVYIYLGGSGTQGENIIYTNVHIYGNITYFKGYPDTVIIEGTLTEEQKANAQTIALSDPQVEQLIEGKDYILKFYAKYKVSTATNVTTSSMDENITVNEYIVLWRLDLIGAIVTIQFPDATGINVEVNLDTGEVVSVKTFDE
ncbi:MAG: hypothetical protein H3Z52_08670 [archaeon]|nr:hypothetical protein [archaeon]MCP8320999.1 hypothetical protein [archaeon]